MSSQSLWALSIAAVLVGCSANGHSGYDPAPDGQPVPAGNDEAPPPPGPTGGDPTTTTPPPPDVVDSGSEPADASAPDASKPPRPVKRTLNVQWQGQENYYFCGPGSTRMAISTRDSTPPSQDALGSYMGTTTAGTDHIGLVVGALNHFLATSKYKRTDLPDPPSAVERAALKTAILTTIGDDGFPMVANVISGWRPPGYPSGTIYHYVAIVGYDNGGDSALIADPAGAGAGGSTWTAVPKTYWISTEDLGTWIGGKGYASF
jgi:hypothetical protein